MHSMNPVSRLLQYASTSEIDFRKRFDFSKQFMVDVTEGTYTQLSDRVHRSLRLLSEDKGLDVKTILRDDYEAANLDEAYALWQRWQRVGHADTFTGTKPVKGTKDLSPAHFFVRDTAKTPTTFSKTLKVPPQTVRRWVSGQTRKFPDSIYDALRDIGYPYLQALVSLQDDWIEKHS
jgi:hypothetical protein